MNERYYAFSLSDDGEIVSVVIQDELHTLRILRITNVQSPTKGLKLYDLFYSTVAIFIEATVTGTYLQIPIPNLIKIPNHRRCNVKIAPL